MQTDGCIMDDNEILLLLWEDKRLMSMKDLEPQVIAEAIAAFLLNNQKREHDLNLPPCNSIMFPCLTMVGTMPVFYKITITAALSKAVQTGTYPKTETCVLHCIPALPCRNSEGIHPLLNRLEILRCLEAFKNSWVTEIGMFSYETDYKFAELLVTFSGKDKQVKNRKMCGCFFCIW